MGRWMSPDPGGEKVVKLDDPQTWNMYAYVRNNPTTLTDPTGLKDQGQDQGVIDQGLCRSDSEGACPASAPGQTNSKPDPSFSCLGCWNPNLHHDGNYLAGRHGAGAGRRTTGPGPEHAT